MTEKMPKAKLSTSAKFKVLSQIIALLFIAYYILVCISHYALAFKMQGYHFEMSLLAPFNQTVVAKELLVYFGLFTLTVFFFFRLILFLSRTLQKGLKKFKNE